MKKVNVVVLFSFIFLTGCHSFYKIDTDELRGISNKDVIQLKFVNGKKLNITNVQHANITANNELEIIKYSSAEYTIDSVRTLYPLNEVKEIGIKKVSIQKSIFSTLWITMGVAAVFLVLLCSGGCSVGG